MAYKRHSISVTPFNPHPPPPLSLRTIRTPAGSVIHLFTCAFHRLNSPAMSSAAYRGRRTDTTFPIPTPGTAGHVFSIMTARGRAGPAFSEPTVQIARRVDPEVSQVIKAIISNKWDRDRLWLRRQSAGLACKKP